MTRFPLLNATGSFDKSAILAFAWREARADARVCGGSVRSHLKQAFRAAWDEAKRQRAMFEFSCGRGPVVIVSAAQAPEYADTFEQWGVSSRRLAA